jgi:hypothetical protein
MKISRFLWPVVFPVIVIAQGTSTGGSSLKLPQHALTASLADLAAVEAGRLEAAQLNPATLASSQTTTAVAFTHSSWIQDISGQRLALAFPTGIGRFSASVAVARNPGIEVRESPGPPIATFDAQTASLQVGWASGVIEGIVAGVAASYLYEKLYLNESTGLSVDAGILAETPIDGLTVGLSAVNLGGMSAFRKESSDIPATARVAVGYRVGLGHFDFRPAIAFRSGLNHEGSGIALGGTVMFDDLVGLRTAWQSGESARSLSVGLTASYRGIGLEYALVPFSSGLGTAQVLTIGVNF